jgi:hypothetical protein
LRLTAAAWHRHFSSRLPRIKKSDGSQLRDTRKLLKACSPNLGEIPFVRITLHLSYGLTGRMALAI